MLYLRYSKGFIYIGTSFSKGLFIVPEAEWYDFYIIKWKNTLKSLSNNLYGI